MGLDHEVDGCGALGRRSLFYLLPTGPGCPKAGVILTVSVARSQGGCLRGPRCLEAGVSLVVGELSLDMAGYKAEVVLGLVSTCWLWNQDQGILELVPAH